jgi:phosphoribosylformylglycinamidine synthase
MGQIADVSRAVTMDLKSAGNLLYQVGATKDELGGSHFALVENLAGGQVPRVDFQLARRTFAALHRAIDAGLVRACHDLSEGGLAASVAEMAFAGNLGARVFLGQVPHGLKLDDEARGRLAELVEAADGEEVYPLAAVPQATAVLLFSESNTRFLCEVTPENAAAFEQALSDVPHALVGEVVDTGRLEIVGIPAPVEIEPGSPHEIRAPLVVSAELAALKEAWQQPLRW